MSEKISVDIEELKAAEDRFAYVADADWFTNMLLAWTGASLSENWRSVSGKEFKEKMFLTANEIKEIQSDCAELQKYCKKVRKNAEDQNDIIAKICNRFVELFETLWKGGLGTVDDILDSIGI